MSEAFEKEVLLQLNLMADHLRRIEEKVEAADQRIADALKATQEGIARHIAPQNLR